MFFLSALPPHHRATRDGRLETRAPWALRQRILPARSPIPLLFTSLPVIAIADITRVQLAPASLFGR